MQRTTLLTSTGEGVTSERAGKIFCALALAWVPALLGHESIGRAAALYPLAQSVHPYVVPGHAWLLYFWSPLVVLSACVLFLSPGLILSLALNAAKGFPRWILTGFALSVFLISFSAGVVQGILARPLQGVAFALVICVGAVLCFVFLLWRGTRRTIVNWPFAAPGSRFTTASVILFPLLLLIVLTPKFYWENFNGDGAHAFESARLLLSQLVPFFSPIAGPISGFPTARSFLFALPASWFIRLFGPIEVSARLPLLLYLGALFAAIIALVEARREKVVTRSESLLVWLALAVYVVVMAYSATYNPYCADLALPATQDTLLVVCFLGFVVMFTAEAYLWMWLFCALTLVSLPNGTMLIGLWLLGALLFWRPQPWRGVIHTVAALVICGLVLAASPWILGRFGLPQPGQEYATIELLKRFRYLWLTDWKRFAYVMLPCGILPVLSLLLWKRQDPISRALTFVTAAYFLTFYAQAFTPLHYFVPVMLFPLVVYWRSDLAASSRFRNALLGATAAAALGCLVLSMPVHWNVDESGRLLGSTIEDRADGYEVSSPAAFRRGLLLQRIVPPDWSPDVPEKSFGGSELVWNYYAHSAGREVRVINYVLQDAISPPPSGMHPMVIANGDALYVGSDNVTSQHRSMRPPTPAGARVYWIPRRLLFRGEGPTKDLPIIDLLKILDRVGMSSESIRKRLK